MKKTLLFFVLGIAISTQSLMAQVPSYVPTNGLVGYWPFNGNADDASGNGNNGTVNGATLSTDKNGNVNAAYSFNGTSNNIGIPQPFLGGVQVSSFSFYTRIKTIGTPANGSSYNIWGKSFYWGEVNFGITPNNALYIIWANSNGGNTYTHIQTNSSITPEAWTDVVITFENSTVKIYFNGILQATTDYYGTNSLVNFAQDANSNKIGSRLTSGQTGGFFSGKIDDFGIWNRALTQQEITTMYNGSQTPTYSDTCNNVSGSLTQGLVGYWPFCGNANDDSGHGYNGIVSSATLSIDRFGNSNSAYLFNAANGGIYIPSFYPLNSNYSVSYWVKYNTQPINTSIFDISLSWLDLGEFVIFRELNNSITFATSGSNGASNNSFINAGFSTDISNWYNVIVCRNGVQLNLYINGVLVATGINNNINQGIAKTLFFGGDPIQVIANNNARFSGKLDDIGIWNRTLTPSEVTQLYNQNQCFTNTTVTDTLIINVGQLSYTNPVAYANNITIFPNPTSTQVNISFNNITDLTGGNINIINSLGQQVATTPITLSGTSTTMSLDTWGGSGLYFVQILNAQGIVVDVKKIILQ